MVFARIERCLAIFCLLALGVGALVIPAAPPVGQGIIERPSTVDLPANTKSHTKVRIRTSTEPDIPTVAELLAIALNPDNGSTPINWKVGMERLRTKAAIESLLFARMQTIREEEKFRDSYGLVLDKISRADQLCLLWSNDKFRKKLEKAVHQSTEPHVWNSHNFAVAPKKSEWLQHKMITASTASGEIVGFCEIAMLVVPKPADASHDAPSSPSYAPTIVNLVTSPRHRRKGIASALIRTSMRLVQSQWSTRRLGLYVQASNISALQLYQKHGFEISGKVEQKGGPQLYMMKEG